MSSIDTNNTAQNDNESSLPIKLGQAIANPLFPALDSALRAGRHITLDELDNHEFLLHFQPELELFYLRYNTELIRAPEGFFYLRPRSTTLIARSVLSALEMMLGKILCYLYLSPERLAHEGVFTFQELYEELLSLTDENRLLKFVNQRSTGSDLDRQKLHDKVRASLNRLRRLGMITFINADGSKFIIAESVFRFGADVRNSDDMREAQLKLIRCGEGVIINQDTASEEQNDESSDENTEEQP